MIQRQDHWQRQLRRYTLLNLEASAAQRPPFWCEWVWYQNLQTFVSPEKLKQWQLGVVASLVVAPALLSFNGMDWYVALPLSVSTVLLVVWFAYQQLQQKAKDQFRDELPDVIDGLIRALRVGAPMVDVFHEMAQQHQDVTARLFDNMHDELKVGQTLDEVMKNAAQRMPIAEFRFLTIVLSLQQETGGRLTGVLERLGHTLRSRAELNASIQSITSESRNSAKVLAALPILVCLVLFTTGREHFDFLMTSNGGQIVMAYVVGSILGGLYLIRRMTQLKG
nr:type II secretion system F family protein [Vibrio hepatarius]